MRNAIRLDGVRQVLGVLALGLLLAWGRSKVSTGLQAQSVLSPREIVAAWEKAGAQTGWMGRGELPSFPLIFFFRSGGKGKAGEVPAFRFGSWKPGVLRGLPPPSVPFGLDLSLTGVTGAGLKELAGLQQLQVLSLSFTRVTDAGVAELRKLLPRCSIIYQ